jgi:uncharacterized protein YjiS (DUF1127 family)
MAYVTDFFSAENRSLKDRVAVIRKAFAEAREQRRIFNRTLSELRSLNARELADLGINAAQIPYIARDAAYGVK